MDELLSPEVKLKLSTHEAAYRLRNGSPDFRNALRERCRRRVKLKRGTLFDHMRNMDSKPNLEETLSTIFISELKNLHDDMNISSMEICDTYSPNSLLDNDLKILEEIKNEIIQEQEQWIITEYEAFLESQISPEDAAAGDQVFCPICQRCLLVSNGVVVCCPNTCIVFPPFISLFQIDKALQAAIQLHNSNCLSNFGFLNFQESEIQGLHMMCHDCSFFLKVLSF